MYHVYIVKSQILTWKWYAVVYVHSLFYAIWNIVELEITYLKPLMVRIYNTFRHKSPKTSWDV